MKKMILVAALLLRAAAVHAAGGLPEDEKVVATYYREYNADRFDKVVALYSKEFLKETPPDKALARLKEIKARLGREKSHRLASSEAIDIRQKKVYGTNVTLQYKAEYEKGRVIETFNVFRPSKGREYRILGHDVEFDPAAKGR
jgi:hypothetical protein